MRSRTNWIVLAIVVALTAFSVIVVWPGAPKRYLPDFVPWPEGNGLKVGGFERREMRLGLDLKGGSYLLLEADVSRLPPDTDVGEAMEGVKDILERRVNRFGLSETEITVEGSNRLAVQVPGIDPGEAKELLGKTAQLEFREPVLEEETRNVTCGREDGSQFSVPPAQVNLLDSDGQRTAQCFGADGEVGEVLWQPATGTDSQGAERVLTGGFLRPNAEVIGPPVQVAIEFTGEGSLLFEQITTRLVGIP
ncbi:unnamed protein product, partial [marine sediment metagenome]